MLFTFGFYSSLLLITCCATTIFTIIIFFKAIQTKSITNALLGLLIFLCTSYNLPWMLGFGGWYDTQPYREILFYIPFQQLFFIGPILFFFTKSYLNTSLNKRQMMWHLLPGILYNALIFFYWLCDKLIFSSVYFYADGADKDFENWYQLSGMLSMSIYSYLSLQCYFNFRDSLKNLTSNENLLRLSWMKSYLFVFLGMISSRLIFFLLAQFHPYFDSYIGSWWFFFFFGILTTYLAFTGNNNANLIALSRALHSDNVEISDPIQIETSQEKSDDLLEWTEKIQNFMNTEKPYQNFEFTLVEMAKSLQTNTTTLSKNINKGFQKNFNDFVNEYRIMEVIQQFESKAHISKTIIAVAYDAGFNSKATFNRAFKKQTGLTPKEFLNNLPPE